MNFKDKIVAITGAGSGFGRHIALAFAERGARVFASDISPEGLAATSALVPEAGIHTARVDVTDRQAAAGWVAQIEAETGRALDVLVNNAGGAAGRRPGRLEDVTDADWDAIVEINLNSSFVMCRAAVPAMKRAGTGRIINISSGAGVRASFFNVQAYGSAKHGVVGLTRVLAQELGQYGITVNSVAPGLVLTCERQQAQWQGYGQAAQQDLLRRIALRRLATEQDIANPVLFFASELAAGITGEVLSVGLTA